MIKKFYIILAAISSLLIFCNFQCDNDTTYCEPRKVAKVASTFIIPASQKYYTVGDTIVLQVSLPYTNFSDLNTNTVPIRRYEATQNFELFELTGGAPYNCRFAGDKFDIVASHGSYFLSGPGYSLQALYANFESDSLIANRFISEIKLVPKQPGRYVIFDVNGSLSAFQAPCDEMYAVTLSKQWSVLSRNAEILSEIGLTGDLSCQYQNVPAGFQIPRNDQRLFYFYVQ